MRPLPPDPLRPRPWYARPAARVASVALVAVLVVVIAGVAWNAQRGGAEDLGGLVVVPNTPAAHSPVAGSPPPAGVTSTPPPEASTSATPAASAPPSATATASLTPTTAPTPPPPAVTVALQPPAAGIGETVLIRAEVAGAASASLLFRGASYPMVHEDASAFWAVVGVPLDATAGQESLTVTARDGAGNVLAAEAKEYQVVPVERPVDRLTVTEEVGSVLTPEAGALELQLRNEQFSEFDRGRQWDGPFVLPVAGPMTTQFGQGRSINGGPVGAFHTGTDLANELGTPIVAAAPGRVCWVGEMPIRGNAVIIDHGSGVKTGYHHLSATLVEVGQMVAAGQVIGEMGSTGFSTGPHLHWELTIYGINVDPMTWLTSDFTP